MEFKLSEDKKKQNLKKNKKEKDATCNLVINVDRNYTEC